MSKKGRLKLEHLSLKGTQSKSGKTHALICITSQFTEHYDVIQQIIMEQNNENQALVSFQQQLDIFIHANSLKQQLQSFQWLSRFHWNETNQTILSLIGAPLFKLSLSLIACSLNKDFIKILCRLLDKLYNNLFNQTEFDYSQLISIFDEMIADPREYHIRTLNQLLSCSFLRNYKYPIVIWRVLKLLNTQLAFFLLDTNSQRACLFGRDVVAAFWFFLTNNSATISSQFQSVLISSSKDANWIIINNVFDTCHKLFCVPSLHKDAITKIAFMYHLLLTYIYTDYDQQMQCFKQITSAIHHANGKTNTNTTTNIVIYADWKDTYILSKMGLIRAIITQSHIDVLTFEFMDTCYDITMNDWCVCSSTRTDPSTTLYLFDTICCWITTNYNIITNINSDNEMEPQTECFLNTLHSKLQCIYTMMEHNWDHPSRAVAFVIETMFSKYIQIMDKYNSLCGIEDIHWMKYVSHAMHLSMSENGKYLRLKVLMKRVGALCIFEKYPNWIMTLLEASCFVGGNAISLAQESLNLAKQQMHKMHDDQALVMDKWRKLWMDSVCRGFVHPNDAIRRVTTTDFLKYLIRKDPASYFPLIEHIIKTLNSKSIHAISNPSILHALIGILRSGRKNGIITNDMLETWMNDSHSDEVSQNIDTFSINRELMFKCLLHYDFKIRIEALDIICASKWSTDIPGNHQLELLRSILPYSMKLQMNKHRDQFIRLIQKLLLRIKDGCYKILHETHKKMKLKPSKSDISQKVFNQLSVENQDKIINSLDFIEWFRSFLVDNLYPSAPVERVQTSITLYYFLLQIWSVAPQVHNNIDKTQYGILQIPLLMNDEYLVNVLLNCMMNPRDQVRLLSAKILKLLASPLPGYHSEPLVIGLVRKCLILSTSPRLLESDCGALMLAIIFDKYTKGLFWSFDLLSIFSNFTANNNTQHMMTVYKNEEEAILSFIESFNQILNKHIAVISVIPFHERYRSSHHRVHGLLTFFREMLPHLSLKSRWKKSCKLQSKWKVIFADILKNIFKIGELSLILHTRNPKQKEIENINSEVALLGIDCRGHMTFSQQHNCIDQQTEQMIVVSSWLCIKESCLCLAKFIENCPLPKSQKDSNSTLIQIQDIQNIGAFFLRTLQTTRHNGVMEKSHAGFQLLCRTLLASGVITLQNMVREWLEQLLNVVKNEAAEHWIRRSAGFPFSFLAILEAESKVTANDKPLFIYTIRQLFIEAHKEDDGWQSKVVSLNIIMFIFRNASFNLCVIPFISEAFQIVLPGFAHKQWAVRNSSMLCLSAIMSRAIRKADRVMQINNMKRYDADLLNIKQYIDTNNEEHEFFQNGLLLDIDAIHNSANKYNSNTKTSAGTTAEIFFNQNPDLYSFLSQHLNDATKDDSNMHPSLFPVLLLLSKLNPRNNSEADVNGFTLRVFKDNVMKCASHKYQRVRIMSARALVSLISKNEFIPFLKQLIAQLPSNMKEIQFMNALHGLLLQMQYILRGCYDTHPKMWIVDEIIPILIHKLWILNSIKIASVVQQALIIICTSLLHHVLLIQRTKDIHLSSKQSEMMTLFLMRIYKCGLIVLSNKSETKNDIHSKTDSALFEILNEDHDASESDIQHMKTDELDIGQRRLRSFAAKILIESLLLSQNCAMNKQQVTQLICAMMKDSDELVVQSAATCLCRVMHYYKSQQEEEEWIHLMNKIDCSDVLLICMNLMKWQLWLRRRLASIIQLFEAIIQFDHKYMDSKYIATSIQSLWNVVHEIAVNNSHFVVQIAAMQCLGTMIHILLSLADENKEELMIASILNNWISILNKFSHEDTSEELRSVCVTSIKASCILLPFEAHTHGLYTNEVIDVWLIMIQMLQDFELPIRNIASQSISFLFRDAQHQDTEYNSSAFVANYCIAAVFDYLSDNFMCKYLLQKLIHFIIHPNVAFYTEWLSNENGLKFKLFLPERPNDSFEPLLTMQLATNVFLKYVESNADFDILCFIDSDVINNILCSIHHIHDIMDTDLNKYSISIGRVMDAQIQLVSTIWMIHWFSLLSCYQIISSSTYDNQNRYKLCTFVMNKLKSTLDKVRNDCGNIITSFCERYLLRLDKVTDCHSMQFLC